MRLINADKLIEVLHKSLEGDCDFCDLKKITNFLE